VDGRGKPGHDEQGEAALGKVGQRWRGLTAGIALGLLATSTPHAQTIPGALPESAAALAQGEWPA